MIKNLHVYCLSQLDLEANNSRFVTKSRWVIEEVFVRLKNKFKIFVISAHNATLAHNFEFLLITFAFLNLFRRPIHGEYTKVLQM